MIKRSLSNKLLENIANVPAVVLLGARQVGKTTLSKTISKKVKSIYLDLESPGDQLKLSDPINFLSSHSDKLVILDEIQHVPGLFSVLRGLIDKNRRKGKKSGQFLLLGSASMDLMQQSQSLAGRVSYLEMSGLNLIEAKNKKRLWLRGGFPDIFLSKNDNLALDRLEDLIRSYLERDIPQMGFRIPASRLRRLWTMLAHLQGEIINYSKLAANLEIDSKTVKYYIDVLADLLLVRRIEPWHSNTKKRLVKSPRYYLRDSGIQHRLLGIDSYDSLLSNPVLGKSWEGFVIENIHSVLPKRTEVYFYRTLAGAEIDLVIKMPSSKIWAVEIKHGTVPKIGKHFIQTCKDVGAIKKFVIYGGKEEFPIGNGVTVISLLKLLDKIRN